MMTLFKFKNVRSNTGTRYFQHDTWNLNRVCNGCTMVEKPGTIVLIMKMASKVGPLSLCFCMKFLTSNDFGGRLSANPSSLTVGYSRTRTRIYKSTAYRRESESSKTLGGTQIYKYPLLYNTSTNATARRTTASDPEHTSPSLWYLILINSLAWAIHTGNCDIWFPGNARDYSRPPSV